MELNRRNFVVLAAVTCAGCNGAGSGSPPSTEAITKAVDAGAASDYVADGVYDHFRNDGFFLVREGEVLFAVSAICTHRECKLRAQPDHSFYCKCHGSRFDENGKVTKGPATRDLPRFETSVHADGHLIVQVRQVAFDD